jgi:uncharacterized protein
MRNAAAKTLKMSNKVKYWIEKLNLQPHPEGGYFREVYRSDEIIFKENLPERYTGDRSFSTSIYFLLERGEVSAFHRIKSDETWYFHDGDSLEIYSLDKSGSLRRKILGLDIENGDLPQLTIKRGSWFAAQTTRDFTLVGCNVSPGFDFADFEMGGYAKLVKLFPQHEEILRQFC